MIDELLKVKETGFIAEDRDVSVTAEIDESCSIAEHQPPSFSILREYELYLTVGCKFMANDVQISSEREIAVKQLKHSLYRDIIADLYEALSSCRDRQTRDIILRMMSKVGVN